MAICVGFLADRMTLRLLSLRILRVCFSPGDKIEWNEGGGGGGTYGKYGGQDLCTQTFGWES
jgi:hypothetical protein